MKKNVQTMENIVIDVQFGKKGVYPVKGYVKAVGISEKGNKWFSMLVAKKYRATTSLGNRISEFYYTERTFTLDQVAKGKDKVEPYFELL